MRFLLLAVPTLLATLVHASPFPQSDRNALDIRADPIPSVTDTCDGIGAKTKESWNAHNIGNWFVVTAGTYRPDGPAGPFTQDIQKTMGNLATGIYSFYCSPLSHCSFNPPVDVCKSSPVDAYVYFILHSAANFNNWLESVSDSLGNTVDLIQGKAGKLVQTFLPDPTSPSSVRFLTRLSFSFLNIANEDEQVGSGPMVIASGIIGGIGALFTPLGPLAGVGSGLLGVGIGVMGTIDSVQGGGKLFVKRPLL